MANWIVSAKWTPQVNGLAWDALVTFTSDDSREFKDVQFKGLLSSDNARRIFGNQIAQYEAAGFAPANGAFDMTPPIAPPPDPPTEEQIATQKYEQAKRALAQLKSDVDLGLEDQAKYDTALADAKALKPADAAIADAQV